MTLDRVTAMHHRLFRDQLRNKTQSLCVSPLVNLGAEGATLSGETTLTGLTRAICLSVVELGLIDAAILDI